MRNLKKLLAVIVAICTIATLAVPAFAEESFSYETQAKSLYDMKLFAGNSSTEYVPALGSSLSREAGIILLVRLFGKEADALAMTDADADAALATYTDAKDIAPWAKKYVAYAVKNGMVQGATTTTIAPAASLVGNAFATMILRNLGYEVDSVAYQTAAATLQTKGGILTAEQAEAFANKALIRDDAVGMMFSSLTAVDTNGKTPIENLIAAGIVTKAQAEAAGLVSSLAIKSVAVIGASKIKVEFATAVDTSKATFEVKNGSFLVPVTVTWNDAKTEATLTKSFSKYLAGNYTVTVKGLDIAAGKDVATFAIETERIESIQFTSNTLIKVAGAGSTTAKIGYKVYNQYGEDITSSSTIYGVSSYGSVTPSAGTATVNKGSAWASTDPTAGTVTLYVGTKSVTATVTLADAAAVSEITLGELKLASGVERLIPSTSVTTANIPFTAVDQYGNTLTLTDLTGITPVYGGGISNATVITDPSDSTKKVIKVDLPASVTAKTTATLTLIINNTGKSTTTTFDMYPAAAIADFTLTPDTKVIKAGTGYKVWIEAVDTYGTAVKAADLAGFDAQFAINTLNNSVFTLGADVIKYDSSAKKAYIDVQPVGAGSTANLVVTLKANGKNASLPITVNAASQIVGMTLSANALNFATNGSAKLKASFVDQYGEAVKADTNYEVSVLSDTDTVVADIGTKTIAEMVAGITVAPVTDVTNKTAKLTVTLIKKAVTGPPAVPAQDIDSQSVAIKVIDGSKTTLTYEIADFPTLNGLGADTDANLAASAYAKSLTLTAKDSSGNIVYVPNSVIREVISTNPALVYPIKNAGTGAYKVVGLAAGITSGTEASATLTVVVENYDGTAEVASKTVTVSKAALAAASLKAYLANGTEVTADIEGVIEGNVIDAKYLNSTSSNANSFYFKAVDQYGVVMAIPTVVITSVPAGATVSYNSATGALTTTGLASGKSFNLTAITANGLSLTVKVVKQ